MTSDRYFGSCPASIVDKDAARVSFDIDPESNTIPTVRFGAEYTEDVMVPYIVPVAVPATLILLPRVYRDDLSEAIVKAVPDE